MGVGMAIDAVYITTGRLRRNTQAQLLTDEDRYQMLAQSVKESVKGHDRASYILIQRWVHSREVTLLSFGSNII